MQGTALKNLMGSLTLLLKSKPFNLFSVSPDENQLKTYKELMYKEIMRFNKNLTEE